MTRVMVIKHRTTGKDYCRWIDAFTNTYDALLSASQSAYADTFAARWKSLGDAGKVDLCADLLRPRFYLADVLDRTSFTADKFRDVLTSKRDRIAGWLGFALEDMNDASTKVETVAGVGVWHVLMLLNENRGTAKDHFPEIARFVRHVAGICHARANVIIGATARIEQAVADYNSHSGIAHEAA